MLARSTTADGTDGGKACLTDGQGRANSALLYRRLAGASLRQPRRHQSRGPRRQAPPTVRPRRGSESNLKPYPNVSHPRFQMTSLGPAGLRRAFWRKGVSFSVLLAGLFAFPTGARAASGPHGTIDLISEQTSVQPGQDFRVGLHFQLEKGWHIYWLNPGDSGEPPKVQWNLPAGFRAGPLEWPTPQRIEDHSLIDYGYEDEVLMAAGIFPPARPAPYGARARTEAGHALNMGATVNWLVCRETCIPGRATLTLSLPVREDARGQLSAHQELFVKARARLPKRTPNEWKMTGTVEGREFILDVETGRQEAAATFFPLEPNLIENAAPQNSSPLPLGIRLKLQRSDRLLKPVATLAGVLVLDSAHSYVINVPVHTSKPR